MSGTPLIVLQIYFEDPTAEFDAPKASSDHIENLARSRFVGRESALLALRCGFRHLGSKESTKELADCKRRIAAFTSSRAAEIVIVINTHADPGKGGLYYTPTHTVSLDAMLDHLCRDMSPRKFLRSTLFLLCCGGLVTHAFDEVRRASQAFNSVFAFDASQVDPVVVSANFVATILEYGVFGRETIWNAFQRAGNSDVLFHTAVYAGIEGKMYRMRYAPVRHRPNGEDVLCCLQEPKYVNIDELKQRVLYRCQQRCHKGPRRFIVKLLPTDEETRWVVGDVGQHRYITVSLDSGKWATQ
ncbi:uncharacterized protein TRAVEDRAFT_49800 [Trametes versicolor FP-101664 SS1]|uniref:uncharacterized protein n=1 Tax=Trametes versicolor (strain FP-101664) TaxID=717944 RepID=UPI00046238A1|nr:uncharacterized protein TRAVEDRAFT_49800 [Trametes versicolor FP-101664 SS1]EIW56988.1 hypothetical protein TRAVEDRAFT_49800 [Trametes versicolor FP-101664 SS1]